MEKRVTNKTISISDTSYKINKIDARSACWLFSFLGARSEGSIMSGLGKCSMTEFNDIQSLVLKQVFRLDSEGSNVFPVSIIAPDGSFTDSSMSTDAELIFRLTTESIVFNLSPFLAESGSN